jgi:hypothetical protein
MQPVGAGDNTNHFQCPSTKNLAHHYNILKRFQFPLSPYLDAALQLSTALHRASNGFSDEQHASVWSTRIYQR